MDWEALERAPSNEAKLLEALEGWRVRKHPRYADLVDELGKGAAPLAAKGDFHKAWLAAAASVDDVGPLLATLTRSLPEPPSQTYWPRGSNKRRYKSWIERVEALASRRDDPRTAHALLAVLKKAPWATSFDDDVLPVAEPAVNLITKIGDPRTVAVMQGLLDKPVAKRQVRVESNLASCTASTSMAKSFR